MVCRFKSCHPHLQRKKRGENVVVDIEAYMKRMIGELQRRFGERLLYVGLQGSYLRGEATENSDIDVMTVIDGLSVSDLDAYRAVVLLMEEPQKACGFICSRTDLANWNPLEICFVSHSTKDYYGTMERLIPAYTEQDIRNFVKVSVNNLYHEICHRYIYAGQERSKVCLPGAYKSVFFILQSLYYLEHGKFIATKAELLPLLSGSNAAVLERAMLLKNGEAFDFAESFALLFAWCQDTLKGICT